MFNSALLTEQLRRFWPIPALATLAHVLMVYVPIINTRDEFWAMNDMVRILSMRNHFLMMIVVATSVVTAFCVFGCFFNKRAATCFYTLPINKRQLFWTNAAAGIILTIIPVVIFCALMLYPMDFEAVFYDQMRTLGSSTTTSIHGTRVFHTISDRTPGWIFPGGHPEGYVVNTVPVVASFFVRLVIVAVFYFGVAWLAYSLAGHGIIALLLVAILPYAPMTVLGLGNMVLQLFVFGYHDVGSDFGALFMAYHNPATWSWLAHSVEATHTQVVVIPALAYIGLGAAIFLGAYFVSRARKPERTGNSIMFEPVKNVLVFTGAVASMLIFGVIFFAASETMLLMHIGFVVGFPIGFLVAQMIAEKSFYVVAKFKSLPVFGGIAAAVYIAILAVTQFGLGFYTNRIPAESEIYGVYVTNAWIHGGLTVEDWQEFMVNTDPAFISETRNVHRAVLDGRSELHQIPSFRGWQRYTIEVDGEIHTREPLFIKYLLHDGSMVTRVYSLPGTFVAQAGLGGFFGGGECCFTTFPGDADARNYRDNQCKRGFSCV